MLNKTNLLQNKFRAKNKTNFLWQFFVVNGKSNNLDFKDLFVKF